MMKLKAARKGDTRSRIAAKIGVLERTQRKERNMGEKRHSYLHIRQTKKQLNDDAREREYNDSDKIVKKSTCVQELRPQNEKTDREWRKEHKEHNNQKRI